MDDTTEFFWLYEVAMRVLNQRPPDARNTLHERFDKLMKDRRGAGRCRRVYDDLEEGEAAGGKVTVLTSMLLWIPPAGERCAAYSRFFSGLLRACRWPDVFAAPAHG